MPHPVLEEPGPFSFRALRRQDFPTLQRWLRTPHVSRWWADDSSLEGLEEMYGGCIDGTEPSEVFVAERAGRPLGLTQRFCIDAYSTYRDEITALTAIPAGTWSIDYLIGPEDAICRGWGGEMIRVFCAQLWRDKAAAASILVPVHAENRASWRALERAGFARVAAGEMEPDNPIDSADHFIYRLDRPAG